MIRLGKNEVLEPLTKSLIFVDADANVNADADADSSIIVPREGCSGELIKKKLKPSNCVQYIQNKFRFEKVKIYGHQ